MHPIIRVSMKKHSSGEEDPQGVDSNLARNLLKEWKVDMVNFQLGSFLIGLVSHWAQF